MELLASYGNFAVAAAVEDRGTVDRTNKHLAIVAVGHLHFRSIVKQKDAAVGQIPDREALSARTRINMVITDAATLLTSCDQVNLRIVID